MDSRRWQSLAAAAAAAEAAEEDTGGAGGPSRRPSRRGMHRASPYAGGPRRWLPVASRIFPTMGDRASSDKYQEVRHESLDVISERQSAEPNTNAAAVEPMIHVSNKFNLLLEGDRNSSHGNGLADIINIINQRHFSRDETERLIEIMRSRTPDLSVEDHRAPGSTAKGFEITSFSTPARLIDPQTPWGTPPSNVHGIGSSPIEIAKAFMEAQTSASVHESQKRKFRALSHGVEADNSMSKVFPKVATDSSVCWPGSVVRGYPNYLTPQSNKGRTLPQPLSCTPYSGSIFQRSIKLFLSLQTSIQISPLGTVTLMLISGTYNNSSGQPQLSTPFSVGSKRIVEDKLASTGSSMVQPPSSSRGQIDVFGSDTSFFPRGGSAATKSIAFNLQGPDEKSTIESRAISGHTSVVDNVSSGASVSVHPKSSETAFKILQHLDRTIPSPTLKPLDLRQTLAKRNTSSVATNSQIKGLAFSIGNGHRQSGTNETGSGNLETADAKKVPPSSPNAEVLSQKIQSSGANTEVPETRTSQQPLRSDSTSAAEVSDKSTIIGFSFTFPVPKAPCSLFEPPPTPTLASPPRTLVITTEDIPKFSFGSSSATNKPVFSFDFTGSSLDQTFKFGSGTKRELCFDIAGKDAVCF